MHYSVRYTLHAPTISRGQTPSLLLPYGWNDPTGHFGHEAGAKSRVVASTAGADEARRREQDRELVARMTQTILELFPSCPPEEARAIAAHTAARGSGRVGRTSAGRALEPEALTAAVVAAIRHNHTRYDQLLMRGWNRNDARDTVRDAIERIAESWRSSPGRGKPATTKLAD
jgi:hypothetical protein